MFSLCPHLRGRGRGGGLPPHPRSRWGGGSTPSQVQTGGTPVQDWMGYPPLSIRRQISIASTCYAAGGIPLAFTQEDFLVLRSRMNRGEPLPRHSLHGNLLDDVALGGPYVSAASLHIWFVQLPWPAHPNF